MLPKLGIRSGNLPVPGVERPLQIIARLRPGRETADRRQLSLDDLLAWHEIKISPLQRTPLVGSGFRKPRTDWLSASACGTFRIRIDSRP
jgi:hypothetical protein